MQLHNSVVFSPYYSGDEVVEKCSEFIEQFCKVIWEQLSYSIRAKNGLQQLLDSIDSQLKGKKADEGINGLKAALREVSAIARRYRNACLEAARRGSRRQDIAGIIEALKKGDLNPLFILVKEMLQLLSTCSRCRESFEHECSTTRQKLKSAIDKYEKKAKVGGAVGGAAAGAGVGIGVGALMGGAILTPFFGPLGSIIAGIGSVTAVVGGIGAAGAAGVTGIAGAAITVAISMEICEKFESLSNDLERMNDGLNTTMEECEDKIKSANSSGERAQRRSRVSNAVRIKIETSLDTMCTKFERVIQQLH